MTTEDKAQLYQTLVEQGRLLENKKSKLKSENVLNMSNVVNQELMEIQNKINNCTQKLRDLVNNG